MANYRNRKLLDLAHDLNNCLFQIPGVCIGYSVEGLEPAHSNSIKHGKGAGIKAHDYYFVASCRNCHMAYDSGSQFSKPEKQELFLSGWERTISACFELGLIIVQP